MAKTQIKNYVFKPGIGVNDNRYPNAYGLLNANKAFIQKEATAYINDKIAVAQQYTPTNAVYTPVTGVIEFTIGSHNFNIGDAILIAQESIRFTCELDSNTTTHDYPRVTDPAYNKALVISATSATSITVNVGISSDTSVHTFVSATANAISDVFFNYTNTSGAKCERDIGYVVDAYLSDLRYGGNEHLRNVIKYYWDQGVAQVDGDRGAEIAAHNFIGNLIKDFIFTQTAYSASNNEVVQDITGTIAETTAQFTPTDATYTPTTGNMTLTIGSHTLAVGDEIFIAPGGITFTCALDDNATTHPYPRASGVPNDTGKDPYYYAPITITAVTSTTITANVGISSDTSVHTFDSALANSVTAGPAAKINTLAFNTVDVITNGILAQPKFVATGVGTIKIQGRYSVDELLLITNATRSEVIYNFTNLATGASISNKDNETDEDFVKYLQITDAITTIKLNYDTSEHLSTDNIQIFVEEQEVRTRPFDFGTDAIERQRNAPPVSMLDADFEYGLQPTKWSAIGTMRGYPSIYEIPGTDAQVTRVVTDASLSEPIQVFSGTVVASGTSDWSWSSATDRNGGVSGNDPVITIIEGDTIRVTNNANSSNPFYFKTVAGTGTANQISNVTNNGGHTGTVITWVTQPGDAGTYYYQNSLQANMSGTIVVLANDQGTGIGQSLITVTTEGAHGFEPGTPVSLKALENSISGASRAEGTFIIVNTPSANTFQFFAKAKVGNAAGQVLSTGYTQLREAGFYTGASIGSPTFTISSNGSSGTMFTQLGVLAGETVIPFDGQSPEIGSPLSQTNIPLGSQVTGVIDQTDGGGTYLTPLTNSNINAGQNQIVFQDITGVIENLAVDRGDGNAIYITDITSNTATFNDNFTSNFAGNRNSYTNIFASNQLPSGSLAEFDISHADDSSFTYVIDAIENDGIQYAIGDKIKILGTDLGGTTPENDAVITVTDIGSANSIAAATISGSHFNNDIYLTNQIATYTGGTADDAKFDIEFLNGTYTSVTVSTGFEGTGYKVGDVIVVPGSAIVFSVVGNNNDLYISVDSVDGTGAITSLSFAGTAPALDSTYTSVPFTSTTASGTGAVIDIQITGDSYVATFTNAGINYLPTETITVAGTDLGGASPANDLTITIDNVGGSGEITDYTETGITYNGNALSALTGDQRIPTTANFNISHNSDGSFVVDVNNPGAKYNVGQELTVSGTLFGGTSPANDLTITIDTVDDLINGTITSVTTSGTGYIPLGIYLNISGSNIAAIGAGAQIDVIRNNGIYSNIAIAQAGSDYQVGDNLIITGSALDGITPLNDLNLRVFSVDGTGGITALTPEFIEASLGDNIDLISTVTMTEATTDAIASGLPITFSAIATIEADFETAHGLVPGDTFITSVDSDDGSNNHNLAAGSYIATEIPTVDSLRFQARTVGSINIDQGTIQGQVYPRPDSFFVHRPFDGGVQLGTGGPQHGAQAIRQSKKYIRYQSGKGIMYTTGALFAPSYDLRSVTADGIEVGSEITITCDDNDHGLQAGGIIRLLGISTPGYNSGNETAVPPKFDYEVTEIVNERTFKVLAQRRLGATTAVLGFGAQMSVVSWHGATVRSGIFDDQNGIFWEYDGTQISVVQRTGTYQVAGTVAINLDTNLLTGTNTRFRDQLKAGDRIIIRGMTHVVSHVNSQTELTVTPDWRGVTNITGAKAMLIFDKKVKQSNFNLDRLDGTGPSGYDIDIAKMQMIGIQYSWYGAGFIDYMLRGADGNFVFAHRMRNSNVNTEAFMRSGNLPVRYEVTNEGPSGKLAAEIDNSQTTISLEDGSFFPTSGTIYIDNEIINYTGRTGHTLTGATRAATFVNFQGGATRSYTAGAAAIHTVGTGVILISQTITPLISHWGSAFITDGGFDEDRGYIFSYAESQVPVSTTKQTAFMIRLAPSVSNAIVGDLGERELLNRAQLLLQGLEITSQSGDGNGIVIEGVLNPQNYPLNPSSVGWSGLSGVAQGGQPSFAQIASGGAIEWSTGAVATTTTPTTVAFPTGTLTLQPRWWDSRITRNDDDYVLLLDNDYENYRDAGMSIGDTFAHPNFTTTTIRTFGSRFNRSGINYRWMYLNTRASSESYSNNTATVSKQWKTSSTSNIWFQQNSFAASNVTIGTAVSDTRFSAGTLVNSINLRQYFNVSYYEVTFNNASDATTLTPGSTTIEFTFVEPPYAQPGETVFSFIANPGERSTLDLSELKELTNTPLGGRGTFPNGPDVLAINVYKVDGTDLNANIILRWGEAQA